MLPPQPDLDVEIQKLGDNADARIEAVALWAQKNVPGDFQNEIMRLGESAEGVQLLEHFMQAMNSESISGETGTTVGVPEDDLKTMMRDPRYWDVRQRDPAFVKQVDEGFAKLYK